MIYEYFLCLVFFFIILATTQGYGIFLKEIILDKKIILNQSEIGIIGFFFLLILSILTHFFIPLSSYSNSIIVLIGIIFYIINLKYFWSVNIKYFFPIIIFLSMLSFSFEYHSDYFWYHLPYINILNQYKIIFGSSNLNDFYGYGHSWLDIMALFTLPKFDNNYSTLVSIIFISYFIIYLIKKFYSTQSEILKVFCILSLIFLFLQYPLIKDYGAEIQINLIYILIFINIFLFKKKFEENDDIFKILIFLIIFSFFLRLNSIIFLPLIFLFFIFNFSYLLNYLNNNKIVVCFYFFSVFLLVFKNITISGCLAYPIYFTCFDFLNWGVGIEHAYERYLMLSAQSKGYLLYIVNELKYESIYEFYRFAKESKFISPFEYLNNKFNWIIYWIKYEHDKLRLLNIIVFLLIVILLSKILYFNTLNFYNNFKLLFKEKFLLSITFLPIISYFYLLPQGRYGGFSIIYVFFALLVSLLLRNSKNLVLFLILIISILYFAYKNISNINKISFYNIYPNENLEFISNKNVDGIEFKIKSQITNGKPNYCNNVKKLCLSELRYSCLKEINVKNGYIFIKPNRNKCTKIIKNYFFF